MDESDQRLEDGLDMFEGLVRTKTDPEGARKRLKRMFGNEFAERVTEEYRRRAAETVKRFRDPAVLKSESHDDWYNGPDFKGAWCWPSYLEQLKAKEWAGEAVQSIDRSSSKIVAHLPHPYKDRFNSRGLVVGYVQSGKTANYTGVIAKAADAGYKLFIVLAGMTNSLRNQTQQRLERELRDPNRERFETLTTSTEDFSETPNPDFYLSPEKENTRILAVVKKNVFVLDKLIQFFQDADNTILEETPVLIIDDEADQASINTKQKADERSATNERLVRILGSLPKVAYVGYTATPFANIFIDPDAPEDLYPKDFMFDLPRSKHYFGAETVFGRHGLQHEDEGVVDGLDIIREVTDSETTKLQPPSRDARSHFNPEMVPSLKNALRYFWLSTAERLARGQNDHSSMLVHTTLYTDVHEKLDAVIRDYQQQTRQRWDKNPEDVREEFRQLWRQERNLVTTDDVRTVFPDEAQISINRADFDEVASYLPEVLNRSEIVIDNGRYEGVDYNTAEGEEPKIVIAIGGNTLSRGLTLEGLTVSYFIRTASAYDTLLQMGRWFGYRVGYEDLPRVWMTADLEKDFYHLATVEEEIREDIARYEELGKTPEDFGVRVRTHPSLNITSRLKMQNVKLTSASYSDAHLQTFLFPHDDEAWLNHNIETTRTLLDTVSTGNSPISDKNGRWFFHNVPPGPVIEFLQEYKVVEEHSDLDPELVTGYIKSELQADSLTHWNIGVFGTDAGDRSRLSLGLSEDGVGCVVRSRFGNSTPANIKALTSARDRLADLDVTHDGYPKKKKVNELRNQHAPNTGFLMLYPIDKESKPASDDSNRQELNAADHVIGIGLMFPESTHSQSDYVTNAYKDVFDGTALEEELPEEESVREIRESEVPLEQE